MSKSLTISDLLDEKKLAEVKTIRPSDTLLDTARILISHNIGALIVTDQGGEVVGIISERDLVRAMADTDGDMADRTVRDVMTRSVVTCALDDKIVEVLFLMNLKKIRHIPVLEGGELRGIISIRELTRAYKLLQVQAETDALTGLSNRRHFLERLDGELERYRRYQRPLSVAMIDIDHFKKVNDTHGHAAGDKVLRALAELLVRELRAIDWAGRLGGEEFAIVFSETDLDKAKLVCERLLMTVGAMEVDIDVAKISITVSIGLTEVGPATQDSTDILKRADELMYAAKTGGRNRVEVDTRDEQAPPLETISARSAQG